MLCLHAVEQIIRALTENSCQAPTSNLSLDAWCLPATDGLVATTTRPLFCAPSAAPLLKLSPSPSFVTSSALGAAMDGCYTPASRPCDP